jgi:hypothetical protein
MSELHLAPARPRGHRQKLPALVTATALLISVFLGTAPVATAASPTPAPAAAAPQSGNGNLVTFGIKPSHATLGAPIDTRSRFDYTATPGAVQPDYVAVSNIADTPVHLTIYASDGFNTDSDGFDLLPASKTPVDVGKWITLKVHDLDIKPKTQIVVPFTVRVPIKVSPGDHVGGIVVSLRTTQLDKKGDRVAVDHRVGTRVYMRIQGPLNPQLTVTDLKARYRGSLWNPFGSGKVTVSYTVHNPGNVRLGVHQAVEVSGWYGAVHSASIPDIPELLPDNAHDQQVVLSGVVPAFHEKAVLTLTPFSLPGYTDGQLTTLVRTVHFWAVPWGLVVLLIFLIIVLPGAFLAWRRSRRKAVVAADPQASAKKSTVKARP